MDTRSVRDAFDEYKLEGGRLRWETFMRYVERTRPKLVEAARTGRTVTYQGLMSTLEIGRVDIGQIVGTISIMEHREGRPLLSAVVVNRATGCSGGGFLGLPGVPKSVRRSSRDFQDRKYSRAEKEFWEDELSRVFDYWEEHGD